VHRSRVPVEVDWVQLDTIGPDRLRRRHSHEALVELEDRVRVHPAGCPEGGRERRLLAHDIDAVRGRCCREQGGDQL